MTEDGQVIWESGFKIVDKQELEAIKKFETETSNQDWGNLRDDLIDLWFLDYEGLSEEEKKAFDEMKKEKRDDDFYEL